MKMSLQSLQHDYEKSLLHLSVGVARSSTCPDLCGHLLTVPFSVFASHSTNKAGTPRCRPQPLGVSQRGTLLDPLVPQLRQCLCTEGASIEEWLCASWWVLSIVKRPCLINPIFYLQTAGEKECSGYRSGGQSFFRSYGKNDSQ